VREHIGRIEVDSDPDKGTTMRIIFPVAANAAVVGSASASPQD
jgi:signal transduction histidine kinase